MGLALQRHGIVLAALLLAGCGEKPAEQSNAGTIIDFEAFEEELAARAAYLPKRNISEGQRRKVASLLKIYRETQARAPSSDVTAYLKASNDNYRAAAALDKIDPQIMQIERRREAALARKEFDKGVDKMLSEHEGNSRP